MTEFKTPSDFRDRTPIEVDDSHELPFDESNRRFHEEMRAADRRFYLYMRDEYKGLLFKAQSMDLSRMAEDYQNTIDHYERLLVEGGAAISSPDLQEVAYRRRRPRFGAKLAAAALTAAAFFASPVGSAPTSSFEVTQPDDPNRSNDGMCDLTPQSKEQLKEDCKLLPDITDGAAFIPLEKPKDEYEYVKPEKIGSVNRRESDLSLLPSAFQDAFANAVEDPIISDTLKKYPVTVYQTVGTSDNAFFNSDNDEVGFEFDVTRPEPESDVYLTYGTIRSVWLHEAFGHGTFDDWYEQADKDAKTKSSLMRLGELCRTDLELVSEGYGKKHGDNLHTTLRSTRKMFTNLGDDKITPEKRAEILAAIDTLDNSLDTPGKFGRLSVTSDKYNRCEMAAPDQVIARLADSPSFGEYFYSVEKADLLSDLSEGYGNYMEKSYRLLHESYELQGLTKAGGHAYNTTERAASTVAIIQTNPNDYVNNLSKLSPKRQEIQLDFVKTLYAQIQRTMPDIAKETNFPYVIYGLQQNVTNAKTR